MLSECLLDSYTEIKHIINLVVHTRKSIRNVDKSIIHIIVPDLYGELTNYKTIINL